ncbi:MAG: hypothetical protein IT384_13135 [Deltaproteobacteria bacterium]|nr:hypothetical protein [Deltaproteobacteria bacterium]
MSEERQNPPPLRVAPRAQDHIDKLRDAGFDTQRFFDTLVGIRDDPLLPESQREALYKLIASESFIWYLEAIRNQPIDRTKLVLEARKLAEEYDAAIRKEAPGERATALAKADIGAAAPAVKPGPTPPPTAAAKPAPTPSARPDARASRPAPRPGAGPGVSPSAGPGAGRSAGPGAGPGAPATPPRPPKPDKK